MGGLTTTWGFLGCDSHLILQMAAFLTLLSQADRLVGLEVTQRNAQRSRWRAGFASLPFFSDLNRDPEAVALAGIQTLDRALKFGDVALDHHPLRGSQPSRFEGVKPFLQFRGFIESVLPNDGSCCALEILDPRYARGRWDSCKDKLFL